MKIIAGLGNPGLKYHNTRHNAGFMVVDVIASKLNLEFEEHKKTQSQIARSNEYLLIKPQGFMNNSGVSVKAVLDFFKITESDLKDELWVIHDDLDIILGEFKIQHKGPKEHNGLISLYQHLKIDDFNHVRVGIESRKLEPGQPRQNQISGSDFVLCDFIDSEKEILSSVIEQVATILIS